METRYSFVAAAALLSLSGAAFAGFSFPSFPDSSGLTLNGYSSIGGNALLLSDGTASGAGSAFFTQAQDLTGPWSTSFTYDLSDGTPPPDFTTGADGITFLVTKNGPNTLGGGGGNVGLNGGFGGATAMFRSWDNGTIDIRATPGNLDPFDIAPPLDHNPIGSEAIRGTHNILITYTPPVATRGPGAPIGNFAVFMDGSVTPVASATIDLQNVDGQSLLNPDGTGWIGFTAATGLGIDVQKIENWSFVPTPGSAGLFGLAGLVVVRRRR